MRVFGLLAFTLCVSTSLWAVTEQRLLPIKKIHDAFYVVMGKGGNIGLLCGKDGILMVDDKFNNTVHDVKATIQSVCQGPVKFVINTHWHFDHVGGNEAFGKSGSIIVAHNNVRKRMSEKGFIAFFNKKTDVSPDIALPLVTFTRDMAFHLNGEDIFVHHIGSGHTDGDSIITFKKKNIIHLGDLYFAGMYPFIDYSSGGSIETLIGTLDKVLKTIDDNATVIPGHGPVSSKKDLSEYLAMLDGIMIKRDALLKQGKSKAQIIAANITSAYDAKWNGGFIKSNKFVELILSDIK